MAEWMGGLPIDASFSSAAMAVSAVPRIGFSAGRCARPGATGCGNRMRVEGVRRLLGDDFVRSNVCWFAWGHDPPDCDSAESGNSQDQGSSRSVSGRFSWEAVSVRRRSAALNRSSRADGDAGNDGRADGENGRGVPENVPRSEHLSDSSVLRDSDSAKVLIERHLDGSNLTH